MERPDVYIRVRHLNGSPAASRSLQRLLPLFYVARCARPLLPLLQILWVGRPLVEGVHRRTLVAALSGRCRAQGGDRRVGLSLLLPLCQYTITHTTYSVSADLCVGECMRWRVAVRGGAWKVEGMRVVAVRGVDE